VLLEVPLPDFIDRWVDDEFEDERGKDAAHPSARLFASTRPTRPVAHMIGINPTNIVATVMNFGRSRFAAPSRSSPEDRRALAAAPTLR